MKVKDLIKKLQKLDEDSFVFLDCGFAINLLEANSVVYDREQDIVIVCIDELEEEDLKNENCKLI